MLIVTPNLTTDRTIELDELVAGGVHRTDRAVETLGGKGVNVARVARAFRRPAPVVGFVPEDDAARLTALAAEEGAELVAVAAPGRARCATVLIERSGRVTVLNEPGPEVGEEDWQRLLDVLAERCVGHASLTCLGSLPPGSPQDSYARCVLVAHEHGLLSVVDATGAALAAALKAAPDLVTPNLSEAGSVLSGTGGVQLEPDDVAAVERAGEAALELVVRGARRAVVTIGRFGAVLAEDGVLSYFPAPRVEVVNPIGAGDSLVGGLVHALEEGAGVAEAVRFGVATAASSCEQVLAGGVDPARVLELVGEVDRVPIGGAAPGRPSAEMRR